MKRNRLAPFAKLIASCRWSPQSPCLVTMFKPRPRYSSATESRSLKSAAFCSTRKTSIWVVRLSFCAWSISFSPEAACPPSNRPRPANASTTTARFGVSLLAVIEQKRIACWSRMVCLKIDWGRGAFRSPASVPFAINSSSRQGRKNRGRGSQISP